MPDSENNHPDGNHSDDGYLRACEGILRTRFGRRHFKITAKAIEQLKNERHHALTPASVQSSAHWREAFSILWRGWVSRAGAMALLAIVGSLLVLWMGNFNRQKA